MPKYVTKDGRILEWSGATVCVCSKCEELFNSVGAFDHHIKRRKRGGEVTHDISKMPRNAKGYLVISLYDYERA